jgi:DNA polymerase-1
LHAELVGISFSYEKGFYVPFPENQVEAKALAENMPFFRKRKNRENWTEFEI